MARNLTDKQEAFVREYLIDRNATQAAIRAGYSPKTAYRIGAELLQKTSVSDEIARRDALINRRLGVSAERTRREMARLAYSNLADLVDMQTGELLEDVDREELRAIASLKVKTTTRTITKGDVTTTEETIRREIKLWPKDRALDMLARADRLYGSEGAATADAPATGVIEMPPLAELPPPPPLEEM